MLVFQRRPGETINIGDDVVVRVTELAQGRVRIGVEAPKSIPIHRGEIYAKILQERARGAADALARNSQAETGSGTDHARVVGGEDPAAKPGVPVHNKGWTTLSLAARENAK